MGRTKSITDDLASRFFCSIPECGERFSKLGNLKKHTKNIHEKADKNDEDGPKYECDVVECGKRFKKRKALCTHKCQVHNQEWMEKYACDRCPSRFAQLSKLQTHSRRHEGYRCSDCDHEAETWSALRRHKADVHPTTHKCDRCGKEFKKVADMKKHVRVHDKEIKCPSDGCDMKMFPRLIAKHVKTFHATSLPDCRQLTNVDKIISSTLNEDNENYECSQCGKTFGKARNLRLHQRNIHDDNEEKRVQQKRTPTFACTMENCDRRFLTEAKLENHLNFHTDKKPLKCPELGCAAAFAGRSALQRHVKLRHMKVLNTYELISQLAGMGGEGESDAWMSE